MSRYPNPLRPNRTSKTGPKSNLLRTRIETQSKRSPNGLKFNIQYSNTMTTRNIYLQVVLLCLGTQTLCGRIEPPKQYANITFFVPGLKPGPKDLQMTSNSIFSSPIGSQHEISIYRSFSYVQVPKPFAAEMNLQKMTQI